MNPQKYLAVEDDQKKSNLNKPKRMPKPSVMCRTCLRYMVVHNSVGKKVLGTTIAQMLNVCVPEVYLGVSKSPVICNGCLGSLTTAFKFQKICVSTESKIKSYLSATRKNHTQIELQDVLNFAEEIERKKNDATETTEHENPFQFKIANVVSLNTPESSSEQVANNSTIQTNEQDITPVNKQSSTQALLKTVDVGENKGVNVQNTSVVNLGSYNLQPIVVHKVSGQNNKQGHTLGPNVANANVTQQKLSLLQTQNGQLVLGYLLSTNGSGVPPSFTTSGVSTQQERCSITSAQPRILNSEVSKIMPVQNMLHSIKSSRCDKVTLDIAATCRSQVPTNSNGDPCRKPDVPGSCKQSTSVTVKVNPQSSVDQVNHKNHALPTRASKKALYHVDALPPLEPVSNNLPGDYNNPVFVPAENNQQPTLVPLSELSQNRVRSGRDIETDPLALDTTVKSSVTSLPGAVRCSQKFNNNNKRSILKRHLEKSSTTDAQYTGELPLIRAIKQEPTAPPKSDNLIYTARSTDNNRRSKSKRKSFNVNVNRIFTHSENASDPLHDHITIKEEPNDSATENAGSVKTDSIGSDDELRQLLKDVPAMEKEDVPEYISIKRVDHTLYPSRPFNVHQPPLADIQQPSCSYQTPNFSRYESGDVGISEANLTKRQSVAPRPFKPMKSNEVACFWRHGYFVWDHDYALGIPSQYTTGRSSLANNTEPPPLVALSKTASSTHTDTRQVEEAEQTTGTGTGTGSDTGSGTGSGPGIGPGTGTDPGAGQTFHCYVCSFESDEPSIERSHLEGHTWMEGKFGMLRCPGCKATYSTPQELNWHCIIHCERCEDCGITLQSWQMIRHRRTHRKASDSESGEEQSLTVVRPPKGARKKKKWSRKGRHYGCGVCSKKFVQKKPLIAHLLCHQLELRNASHFKT